MLPTTSPVSTHDVVDRLVQSTPVQAATLLPPSTDLVTAHDLNAHPPFAHALPAVHVTVSVSTKGVGYVNITFDGAVAALTLRE